MTNSKKIIFGSRKSKLALIQVEEVLSLLNNAQVQIEADRKSFDSMGDVDKSTNLIENSQDDFFTNTLDRAVIDGNIDVAVHSAKDLPNNLDDRLEIFALTKSLDETDAFVSKVHFNDLEDNAKVGTSSLLRRESLKALNPSVECSDIRGTVQERIDQLDNGKYDGIIVATIALKRLGLEDRIKDIFNWDTAPLQGALAIVGRRGDQEIKKAFEAIDIRKTFGQVHLVGAGPGDPDLLTIKGKKRLEACDVVYYDYLTDKRLLQHAKHATQVYVGKRKGLHTLKQSELSRLLRIDAQKGLNVVRLKCGDPMIFGRGAEEVSYLRDYHIPVEIIPGVSSATSIPSLLGIPLTARGVASNVSFVSGHVQGESAERLENIQIPQSDTIVFLMGLTKLDDIVAGLIEQGRSEETPIIIISKGTYPDEKIVIGTLKTIKDQVKEQELPLPALIVVGQIVKFYDKNAHQNGAILYTGTNPEKYMQFGNVIHHPMITIEEKIIEDEMINEIINSIDEYKYILITSQFGVQYFFDLLRKKSFDFENLKNKDFIVIGEVTANKLKEVGFTPSLISKVETSEGLLSLIKDKLQVKGAKILFPRSNLPNPFLKNELTQLGAQVHEIAVYENKKPHKRLLPTQEVKQVIFTSPSTVRNFLEDYESIPKSWKILSKGPLTLKQLQEEGYESEVEIHG